MNKILSIIVPVYNAEKDIVKLVDSLENQEFKGYELILVNDGSTDMTKDVLANLKKKYDNITVINKKNTGVGDTRNIGLEKAKYKYILFADSDDYFCSNFFEVILPYLKKGKFDILCYNANVYDISGKKTTLIKKSTSIEASSSVDNVINYLNGKFSHMYSNCPWNKIYRADIIKKNNITYKIDKKRGQDLLFNIEYFSKIKSIKYIDDTLYNYILIKDSFNNKEYRSYFIDEEKKYKKYILKICNDCFLEDPYRYLALFYLRRLPGVLINESHNPNFKEGKINYKNYFNSNEYKKIMSHVKLGDLDLKLWIGFLIYKFHLSGLIYTFFRLF